jgi:hypothetical protein
MKLRACEGEEDEYGVGAGVNTTLLSRYTLVNRSRRICHKHKGLVVKKTHEPVYI